MQLQRITASRFIAALIFWAASLLAATCYTLAFIFVDTRAYFGLIGAIFFTFVIPLLITMANAIGFFAVSLLCPTVNSSTTIRLYLLSALSGVLCLFYAYPLLQLTFFLADLRPFQRVGDAWSWIYLVFSFVLSALTTFLILRAAFLTRILVRAISHNCPHCTYDLRGSRSSLCPECGRPVPLRGT